MKKIPATNIMGKFKLGRSLESGGKTIKKAGQSIFKSGRKYAFQNSPSKQIESVGKAARGNQTTLMVVGAVVGLGIVAMYFR